MSLRNLNRCRTYLASLGFLLATGLTSVAQAPKESDYYKIEQVPVPEGVVLEAGGMEAMKDGRLAVSTRRGDIYLFSNPTAEDISKVEAKPFVIGLHEVLGLDEKEGWLYATQRGEVTRLKDTDKDGRADLVETVADGWEINGDYHEYAFGSKFDKDGNIWVVLCLTGSFSSENLFRGWCLRVNADGTTTPTCSGIRSPGGIGENAKGDIFYTDNQGPWNGTCSLKWLRPGSFQGHPGGNSWYDSTSAIGAKPREPESGSRIMTEAKKILEYEPPCVLFPYKKMGQSASGIICDTTEGKFSPFPGQLFVGDQTFSTVMRVHLEEINGHYQGACFPFLEGFQSGTLALEFTPDGSLFVGGTNRGWGSRGSKPFSLERVRWNGKTPFEIAEMHAKPDGFEFVFTHDIDSKSAGDPASYEASTYTYIFQSSYGSPEVDPTTPKITKCDVLDKRRVRVYLDKVQEGHVHEFHLNGVKSAEGLPLLHKEAYYTLNYIPSE